ncbi:hypothetical protein RCL1_000099 [Eukaryota sp. TZLM3-RCL]
MPSPAIVRDVEAAQFIGALAQYLKASQTIKAPEWVDLVKTASFKDLAPVDPDWFFVRAASMARKIYLCPGMGVGKFRQVYGGNARRGNCPNRFALSSGSIARNILKQLETAKLVELHAEGGRRISSLGQKQLDQIAARVSSTR